MAYFSNGDASEQSLHSEGGIGGRTVVGFEVAE